MYKKQTEISVFLRPQRCGGFEDALFVLAMKETRKEQGERYGWIFWSGIEE